MSTISITFLVEKSLLSDTDCLSLLLLKEKGISYGVEQHDDEFSGMTIEGNHQIIMEAFYIMKDAFIRKVDNVTDDRNDEVFDRYTMSVFVPSFYFPFLIGRGGSAIEHLRKIAYSKITIKDGETIHGDKNLIIFEGDCGGIPQAFMTVMSRILMIFPRLGWIDSDSHRMSCITDCVLDSSILGKSESYSKAVTMAMNPALLSLSETSVTDRKKSYNTDSSNALLTFNVPHNRVGSIIGAGGVIVGEIRSSTGTQISIDKSVSGHTDRRVDVSGSLENVNRACSMILDHLSKTEQKGQTE